MGGLRSLRQQRRNQASPKLESDERIHRFATT